MGDAGAGALGRILSAHGQIRGEYVEVDPPRRLVLLWGWLDGGDTRMSAIAPSSTRVEIEFIAEGAETLVRLRHSGIPDGDAGELVVWGWTTYLDRIGAAARGEAAHQIPSPPSVPPPSTERAG